MEFLKDLNVPEILKVGAIGLGFLLALMSYYLIYNEQKKAKPNATILKSSRTFMIFSIVLMILGIFSDFIKTRPQLSMRLGTSKIELNDVPVAPSSSLDPKKYFINSEHGFAFKKPDKKWSPVQALKGVAGMYELMPIKNDIFSVENMEEGLKDAKLGPMISNVTIYYFVHEDSKSTVFVTDSTDNDMISEFVNEEANYMFADSTEEYDTTSTAGRRKYQQALVNYRRSIIGFDSMQMKIIFAVSVFPKSALPVNARKLNLPAFYTELSVLFGSIIDKLVADDRQILSGAEFTLNNVMIKKRASDFQSKKWMLCTENNDNFITVELIYSPQISPSINLWDDLQETLKSFTILTEN